MSWLGSSLDDLRAFPKDARRDAGHQRGRVQRGLLHAFEKRTRQTPRAEIALAKKRYADLVRQRVQKPEVR